MALVAVMTPAGKMTTPRFGEQEEATAWLAAEFTPTEVAELGVTIEEVELAGGGAIRRVWRPVLTPLTLQLVWQTGGWQIM